MCKKVITSEVLSLHSGSPLSHCFMTSLRASFDSDVPRSHRQLLQRGVSEGWRKLREGTYVPAHVLNNFATASHQALPQT